MLGWISRDIRILLAVDGLSSFAYTFMNVMFPVYLSSVGFDPLTIGLTATLSSATSSFFIAFGGIMADVFGRKKLLLLVFVLMLVSGVLYATTTSLYLLVIASMMGGITGSIGPGVGTLRISPAAYALFAEKTREDRRNMVFALNSTVSSVAGSAGALFASLPDLLRTYYHLPSADTYRPMFVIFSLFAMIIFFLTFLIGEEKRVLTRRSFFPKRSRSTILRLSVIGSVDGFGTGFILTGLLTLWFYLRFQTSLSTLGLFVSVSSLASAASFLLGARLSRMIGTVNTITFTHIPSVIMLFFIPFSPSFEVAAAVSIIRSIISFIDAPLRQSYVTAVVHPEERSSAIGIRSVSHLFPASVSPSLSGYIMQYVSLSLPFFLTGTMQLSSDIAFYLLFRKIKPPEEMAQLQPKGKA